MNKRFLNKIEEIAFALVPNDRSNSQFFHVAFIFKKNKIYSIGINSFKTHPIANKYGHKGNYLHAECQSIIRNGMEDCSKLNMAVLRISRQNLLSISRPCENCQALIRDVRFKNVLYTNSNGEWEQL